MHYVIEVLTKIEVQTRVFFFVFLYIWGPIEISASFSKKK